LNPSALGSRTSSAVNQRVLLLPVMRKLTDMAERRKPSGELMV
jgi:hypothetical protein